MHHSGTVNRTHGFPLQEPIMSYLGGRDAQAIERAGACLEIDACLDESDCRYMVPGLSLDLVLPRCQGYKLKLPRCYSDSLIPLPSSQRWR